MIVLAIVVLLLLAAGYVVVGSFGLVMSAFCFDAGTSPQAWNCFVGINTAFIAPSVICLLIAIVLLIRRRPVASMIVGAIPAMLVAVGSAVVAIVNLSYFPR
jgi:hypothetical protein